jgi:hypothetical protein
MSENEQKQFIREIAVEVVRAMGEQHDTQCPHGYTKELRESLTKMVEEWNELKPNLKIISSIYAQGKKSTMAFIWGMFLLGAALAFLLGIYETFQKFVER